MAGIRLTGRFKARAGQPQLSGWCTALVKLYCSQSASASMDSTPGSGSGFSQKSNTPVLYFYYFFTKKNTQPSVFFCLLLSFFFFYKNFLRREGTGIS